MELSNDIIIQFFFSLCGLIIAIIIVCFKFFERIINARFEKSDLQRDKKDLEQDMRIKEDIKKEIEELEKRINHMIQNIKHTNNLLMQSLEAQDSKIYKTNERLNNIRKAND